MKKQKGLIVFSIIIIFVLGLCSLLYLKPIFLSINPFYQKEVSEFDDGTIATETYLKYSLIPTVKADVPKGWKVKTIVYKEQINYAATPDESEKIVGDVSIEIYKGTNLIASVVSVTDTGGAGGVYYHFSDSDPEVYESMLQYSIEGDSPIFVVSVVEVNDGEYTKLDLFGLEVRRVDDMYVPNTNEKDTYYFTNPLDPVLLYFEEEGPSYEVYYDDVINLDGVIKYVLWVDTESSLMEEDLLILDSILDSMELR